MIFSELELTNKNMVSNIAYCVKALNALVEYPETIDDVLIYARSNDKIDISEINNILTKYNKSCTLSIHHLILQQLEKVVAEYRSFSNTDFVKNA